MSTTICFYVLAFFDVWYLDFLCRGDKPGYRMWLVLLWQYFSKTYKAIKKDNTPTYPNSAWKGPTRPENANISPFDTPEEKEKKMDEAARNIAMNRLEERQRLYYFENEYSRDIGRWKFWIKVWGLILIPLHLYWIWHLLLQPD